MCNSKLVKKTDNSATPNPREYVTKQVPKVKESKMKQRPKVKESEHGMNDRKVGGGQD